MIWLCFLLHRWWHCSRTNRKTKSLAVFIVSKMKTCHQGTQETATFRITWWTSSKGKFSPNFGMLNTFFVLSHFRTILYLTKYNNCSYLILTYFWHNPHEWYIIYSKIQCLYVSVRCRIQYFFRKNKLYPSSKQENCYL